MGTQAASKLIPGGLAVMDENAFIKHALTIVAVLLLLTVGMLGLMSLNLLRIQGDVAKIAVSVEKQLGAGALEKK